MNAIETDVPQVDVVEAVATYLPNNRERSPDIIISAEPPGGLLYRAPAPRSGRDLSPATRTEDLVRKSTEYLAAGIGQYWIVDWGHRSLDVLEQGDDGWRSILRLDDDTPTGSVAVGATARSRSI